MSERKIRSDTVLGFRFKKQFQEVVFRQDRKAIFRDFRLDFFEWDSHEIGVEYVHCSCRGRHIWKDNRL